MTVGLALKNGNINTRIYSKGGYIMQDYIKHLQSQIEYWQRIALAEREKNIKLEEIIKKIEEKIYNLEDKED